MLFNQYFTLFKVYKQGIIPGHSIVTQLMVGRNYDLCRH